MADLSTPSHGKWGAIYRQRKNNFKGAGELNDATWGAGYNGAASGSFEVVIDAAAIPDTFKWRKNGGAWNLGVTITGAAQTLSDAQQITFGATTGHALGDQWSIGNLAAEACTEVGATAQITDADKRLLNPNSPPVFTDSGGAKVILIDYSSGIAYFDANVTIVTAAGNNGYVLPSGLQKLGYVQDWNMTVNLEMGDQSAMGDQWKTACPGMASGSGGSNAFFIGSATLFAEMIAGIDRTLNPAFLQLFTYDPDQDQTGSHFNVWVSFTQLSSKAPMNANVSEATQFTFDGKPHYVANA